jgi:hypothetical protein
MKGKFYILSTHCTAIETGQASEPVGKRACPLNPNQISELIMDSGSNESLCGVVAMEDEEYCAEVLLEQLQSLSKYRARSSAQAPLSQDSASISEEECSEWVRSTDTIATKIALDTTLSPSEECSTHPYSRPNKKEQQ